MSINCSHGWEFAWLECHHDITLHALQHTRERCNIFKYQPRWVQSSDELKSTGDFVWLFMSWQLNSWRLLNSDSEINPMILPFVTFLSFFLRITVILFGEERNLIINVSGKIASSLFIFRSRSDRMRYPWKTKVLVNNISPIIKPSVGWQVFLSNFMWNGRQ